MAVVINITGTAEIWMDDGLGGAMDVLGYTRNGAEVTLDASYLDVPGDQNGGDEGPPIDVQYLGEIARVRLELTKYDVTNADLVRQRFGRAAAVVGTPASPGSLVFGGTFRLLIKSATAPYNFARAFPRAPIEVNRGTKFSTFICEFECHKDANGKLWDADISGAP